MTQFETTGGYTCASCGAIVLHGALHVCGQWATWPMTSTPVPIGWTCPVCGRGNAPWVATCSHPLPSKPSGDTTADANATTLTIYNDLTGAPSKEGSQ